MNTVTFHCMPNSLYTSMRLTGDSESSRLTKVRKYTGLQTVTLDAPFEDALDVLLSFHADDIIAE